MEPKKKLKKHKLVEPKWVWGISNAELIIRLNQASSQIHQHVLNANPYENLLGDWALPNSPSSNDITVEMGDWRFDGNTYVQDIRITPPPTPTLVEYIMVVSGITY